ncbi:MAG: glycosyltransferase family 2 protein [Bacteroidales bacterium]|nr:glycosyltransferase family 2 protein [Bacteroidales bacterium]
MKISVITPVYNVRPFIRKCVESLMAQTFTDIEYIFVNDASSDGSIDILKEAVSNYPHKNITILTHEVNSGLPASRKTGFEYASGEYIFNCDGDDFVEPTMLQKLHDAVIENGADYAYCDFYLTYDKGERYMACPSFTSADEALRKGYLRGTMKYNVWNKLIKRELYNDVVFPVKHKKGGEDMIMLGILSKAKRVVHIPEALYHYVKTNSTAISESFSEQRLIDIKYNADTAIAVLERDYPADLTEDIMFFKLNVKLPFLITDEKRRHEVWKQWYPEANRYAMTNKVLPLRTRFLQKSAALNQWWLVSLYYKIVYGFIYKLRYL